MLFLRLLILRVMRCCNKNTPTSGVFLFVFYLTLTRSLFTKLLGKTCTIVDERLLRQSRQ